MPLDVKDAAAKYDALQAVIDQYVGQPGPLMPVMHKAQELFGYLPMEVQNFIADGLKVPMTDVYGVATFYSQFTLAPRGEHTVSVCLGTACYVKGAQKIIDAVVESLGVDVGKTSEDARFTVLATRCIGACGLAPVMTVNDDVYGQLDPKDVPDILKKYQQAM